MIQKEAFVDLWVIRVPNWKKFNPRPDRANFTWFRMENTFFQDQSVFALNAEQKMLYLFILCEISKKNEETIKLRVSYISALLRIDVSLVQRDFLYIAELGLIEANAAERHLLTSESRHLAVTLPSNSLATNEQDERTKRTNETNNIGGKKVLGFRMKYPEDFENLWVRYDRKGDKKKAFEVYSEMDLTPGEKVTLNKAVDNYLQANTQRTYRKDFERLLKTDWRETAQNMVQKVYENGLQSNGRYLSAEEKRRYNNDRAVEEYLNDCRNNGEGDSHG